MRNVKQLVRDWEDEKIELDESTFTSASELAQFVTYAYKSLDEGEFEILMEDLYSV